MYSKQLPWFENTGDLYSHFAESPWSVLLDSFESNIPGQPAAIIGLLPDIKITAHETSTEIQFADGRKIESREHPLDIVRYHLRQLPRFSNRLAFNGGAMGYFSYDLIRRSEKLPDIAEDDCDLPQMQIGIYTTFIIADHGSKTTTLYSDSHEKTESIISQLNSPLKSRVPFKLTSTFKSNFSREEYGKAFEKVMNHIREGNCYQINLTQRFCAEFTGSTWAAYQQLRAINPAPHSAYLHLPETRILCFSPEQFIGCHNGHVITKPIKGTIIKDPDPLIDKKNQHALLHSTKDRAENLMIVDLIRNDLGRVCSYGSIKVPELFALKSFANVHHLISTVTGSLADGKDCFDLLAACFPGGSVTGTPKIRAMELIEGLEPNRRSIYCGSIGFMDRCGNMNLNIAIRTLYTASNKIFCSAGGAIVADSRADSEYQESLDKVQNLLTCLSS